MKQPRRLVGVMNDRNRPRVEDAGDAYRHLFAAIVDQRLLPGTKLTEMALVEAFGLGRRAIGTALQRLTWEKLVVFFPKRGAFVAAPDAAEARDVFAARVAIEAGTTEAVARAADPAAIAKLQDNLDQERALRRQGHLREAIHLSGGFHVLMAELSGNRTLAEQVRLLVARTSLIVNLFDNQAGLAGWHDHHDDLIRHCAAGEVEQAVALMRAHITELQDALALDRRRPVAFDMVDVFARD
ncbi:GntR family transcriptional regulator [Rhodoplanes sp. TEM]|uniref:GntR family transcriptional regulator n=1 Tax=Rhodoplanes tepidamans TaxID=200616 RepID=A0ABT5JB35_RHOTP|nr:MULTISPECIES: GntR family transcriptional regulator [Rhodoplanes]MDC7786260.1 GntR family transcriptional regulator [Rhodoplanes tepidamans]MDC7982369.1 GntR family transcriptional regulator [Rhodoplanes sp. TEM]MDQ0355059.1 DNA-binding GntR family transcriptional regulator [Rhodoplanes tepidamans]